MASIECIFDLLDGNDTDAISSAVAGSAASLELIKLPKYTSWTGCGAGAAVAAVAAVDAETCVETCVEVTTICAQGAGAVGVIAGGSIGACIAHSSGGGSGSTLAVPAAMGGAAIGAACAVACAYATPVCAVTSAAGSALQSAAGFYDLSPLHYAILMGNDAAVALFAECRVNLECTCWRGCCSGWTPLHLAACVGQLAAVRALLAASPEQVDARTSWGQRPFDVAAAVLEIFKLLYDDSGRSRPESRPAGPESVSADSQLEEEVDAAMRSSARPTGQLLALAALVGLDCEPRQPYRALRRAVLLHVHVDKRPPGMAREQAALYDCVWRRASSLPSK